MRKNHLLMLVAALVATTGFAQELPTPSAKAAVEQRIGLTDIRVDYHRPNVNDRTIFGDLVPYDQIWRTGANKATAITFSTEATFGGTTVQPGTYSLFAIPGKDHWTIILNSETELWGAGNLKEENNVLRIKTEARETSKNVETFTILFENVKGNSGHLCMKWERSMVCIPISVDMDKKALENIANAVATSPDDWAVLRNSASYYMDNNIDLPQALAWMEKSVALKGDNWYSLYLLGRAQHMNGKGKEAVKSVQAALSMYRELSAKNNSPMPYESMLTNALEAWNPKKKKK